MTLQSSYFKYRIVIQSQKRPDIFFTEESSTTSKIDAREEVEGEDFLYFIDDLSCPEQMTESTRVRCREQVSSELPGNR
jgi:hypothetical protein